MSCEMKARVQDLYALTHSWSLLADPAAKEACGPAAQQSEAAPATCPVRRRHLLGKALCAKCLGHWRNLALSLFSLPLLTEDWKQTDWCFDSTLSLSSDCLHSKVQDVYTPIEAPINGANDVT